jgi:hypothetical protein
VRWTKNQTNRMRPASRQRAAPNTVECLVRLDFGKTGLDKPDSWL